jgi:hypothetical protein
METPDTRSQGPNDNTEIPGMNLTDEQIIELHKNPPEDLGWCAKCGKAPAEIPGWNDWEHYCVPCAAKLAESVVSRRHHRLERKVIKRAGASIRPKGEKKNKRGRRARRRGRRP